MHQKKLDTPIIELYLSLAQPPTLHLCIFVPKPQQVWGGRSSVWRIAQHCTGDIHLAFVEHRDRSWSGIISYQRERAPLCSQKAKPTGIAARGCFHILFLNRSTGSPLSFHWIPDFEFENEWFMSLLVIMTIKVSIRIQCLGTIIAIFETIIAIFETIIDYLTCYPPVTPYHLI